jgi:tRNA pseudouridine55 synthase
MPPSGVINIDKPGGMTSRRAVDLVGRLARGAKVGHAGTLDPLATGVLVVCVGGATRLIEYVQRMQKSYRATFLLGRGSESDDIESEVVELTDAPVPAREAILSAAARLTGKILQRPPAFSALKVAGRRAYELARRGTMPQLAAREVEIHRIDLVDYQYPELTLDIECGGGTYVRALGRDLAESLGTAAVMSALRRTAVGRFRVEQAVNPNVLNIENWTEWLQPPLAAVEDLPCVRLTADELARVRRGMKIARMKNVGNISPAATVSELAAVDESGRLAAILISDSADQWQPKCNLPAE